MNKRDEQRRRREEKQRAAEKNQGTRKLLTRFGVFFVLPVIALVTAYTLLNQAPTYSPIQIADNDHLRGERDAPVTIVVYADFQCPACATEHETMMRLWPEINEDAHLIFRHFPTRRRTPQYLDSITLTHLPSGHTCTASLIVHLSAHHCRR